MDYPIKDDWQRKSKKYRTKYLDCLARLCKEVEEDNFKSASQEVVATHKEHINKLKDEI